MVENRIFGHKSKPWSKIQILAKNPNFGQKSKFWSKIKILVKNKNFRQKAKVSTKMIFVNSGQSYGESGVGVDLRFIPDSISFADDSPRLTKSYQSPDICTEVPRNYEIPAFVTSALTRSKVDLTWDETDKRRTTLLRKGDFIEDQVAHLVASGSETEESDEEEKNKSAQKWKDAVF